MTTTNPRAIALKAMKEKQENLNETIGERTDGMDIISVILILAPELDFENYEDFLDSRVYTELLGTQSNAELTDKLVREWFSLDNAISNLDDDITLGE